MPREYNAGNPLQLRLQAVSIPKGVTPERYLKGLLRATVTGELPRNWEVLIHWRNPATAHGRTKNWQSSEFTEALGDSSAGFTSTVRLMIQQKLMELRSR